MNSDINLLGKSITRKQHFTVSKLGLDNVLEQIDSFYNKHSKSLFDTKADKWILRSVARLENDLKNLESFENQAENRKILYRLSAFLKGQLQANLNYNCNSKNEVAYKAFTDLFSLANKQVDFELKKTNSLETIKIRSPKPPKPKYPRYTAVIEKIDKLILGDSIQELIKINKDLWILNDLNRIKIYLKEIDSQESHKSKLHSLIKLSDFVNEKIEQSMYKYFDQSQKSAVLEYQKLISGISELLAQELNPIY